MSAIHVITVQWHIEFHKNEMCWWSLYSMMKKEMCQWSQHSISRIFRKMKCASDHCTITRTHTGINYIWKMKWAHVHCIRKSHENEMCKWSPYKPKYLYTIYCKLWFQISWLKRDYVWIIFCISLYRHFSIKMYIC